MACIAACVMGRGSGSRCVLCGAYWQQTEHGGCTSIEALPVGRGAAAVAGSAACAVTASALPLLCLRLRFSGRGLGEAERRGAAIPRCAAGSSAAWLLRLFPRPPCSGCGDGLRSCCLGCAAGETDRDSLGCGEALASLLCLCRFLSLPSLPCLCFFFLCFRAFLPPPLSGELPRASSSRLTTNLRGMMPGSGVAELCSSAFPCSYNLASDNAETHCWPLQGGQQQPTPSSSTSSNETRAMPVSAPAASNSMHSNHTCGGGAAALFAWSWASAVVAAGDLHNNSSVDSSIH
jgi:hypothetical protein